MMNTIYYQGSDGCVKVLGDNELAHYKYIKKIGNRYFYTTEALQAYYNDQKKVAGAEYYKDRAGDTKDYAARGTGITRDYITGKDTKEQYERNKKINKAIYDVQGKYRSVKRTAKPVANTAKRAVTPIKTPKDRIDDLLNGPKGKRSLRKKKLSEAEKAYNRYKKSNSSTKKVNNYQSRVRGA